MNSVWKKYPYKCIKITSCHILKDNSQFLDFQYSWTIDCFVETWLHQVAGHINIDNCNIKQTGLSTILGSDSYLKNSGMEWNI